MPDSSPAPIGFSARICRLPIRLTFDNEGAAATMRAYLAPALVDEKGVEHAGHIHVGETRIHVRHGPEVDFNLEQVPLYQLETVLIRWCSSLQPDAVLLHAGCVTWEGAPLLFVAPSGSGKSTMTLAALRAGAAYLTDDLVSALPESLSGLARAIRFDAVSGDRSTWPSYVKGMDTDSVRDVRPNEERRIPVYREMIGVSEVSFVGSPVTVVQVARGEDRIEPMSELERVRCLHEAAIRTGPEYDGRLGQGPSFKLSWSDPARAFRLLQDVLAGISD